jgi:hypothetical protein
MDVQKRAEGRDDLGWGHTVCSIEQSYEVQVVKDNTDSGISVYMDVQKRAEGRDNLGWGHTVRSIE